MSTDDSQPIVVILDTTETAKSFHLKGARFLLLGWYLVHMPNSKLIVSRMFVDETKNHFKKSYIKASDEFKKSVSNLNRASGYQMVNLDDLLPVATACSTFGMAFDERLADWKAIIVEYDQIPTENLAARGLKGNKPFNGAEGKKGLRDAIIWESVLHAVKNDEANAKFLLVSQNKHDFCDPDGHDLQADLRQDLVDLGMPPEKVEVVQGLDKFRESFVAPIISEESDLKISLQSGEYEHFSVSKLLTEVGTELYIQVCDAVDKLNWPPNTRVHNLDIDQSPKTVDYKSVLKVDDSIAVSLELKFSGEISFEETFFDEKSEDWVEGGLLIQDGIWTAIVECVLKAPYFTLEEASVFGVAIEASVKDDDDS